MTNQPIEGQAGDGSVTELQSMTMRRWSTAITQWLDWQKAGGMPTTTAGLRSYQLRRAAHDLRGTDPWDVTSDQLAGWLASHDWARETLRSYRAALRSFYGWAHAAGHTPTDPSRLLRKVPPGQARPRPAAERTVDRALEHATDRVWLMLMLGSRHGLRRGEIAQVHSRDLIDDGDGRWSLLVHGKGAKERTVPLTPNTARAAREAGAGYLFPSSRGGHLTPHHVGKLITRAMDEGTTHQLRHRFASRAYQQTQDIRAVQELLGHASVATTQRYTAVADGALRRVLESAA